MRARTVDDIGRIARQRRQDEGRSQADVAEAAGVTRQWLVRFEQGRSDVSLRNVMTVMSVLKLDLAIDVQGAPRRPRADGTLVPMIERTAPPASPALERGRLMLTELLEARGDTKPRP